MLLFNGWAGDIFMGDRAGQEEPGRKAHALKVGRETAGVHLTASYQLLRLSALAKPDLCLANDVCVFTALLGKKFPILEVDAAILNFLLWASDIQDSSIYPHPLLNAWIILQSHPEFVVLGPPMVGIEVFF